MPPTRSQVRHPEELSPRGAMHWLKRDHLPAIAPSTSLPAGPATAIWPTVSVNATSTINFLDRSLNRSIHRGCRHGVRCCRRESKTKTKCSRGHQNPKVCHNFSCSYRRYAISKFAIAPRVSCALSRQNTFFVNGLSGQSPRRASPVSRASDGSDSRPSGRTHTSRVLRPCLRE